MRLKAGAVTNQDSDRQDPRVVTPFDYKGVRLDDGPFKAMQDEVRRYYLAIPNDDLLKGFRARAGRPAPGQDMGGWYSQDTFNVFGQIVSGLSRLHAATGDPACKEKVDLLVSEWGKCIGVDGYFFYSKKPNARHYFFDKMAGGLVDAHLYAGNAEALSLLDRITTWAERHLQRGGKFGGLPVEWYTLSENLYRAYLVTGENRYRDFAEAWEYPEYWNLYARHAPIPGHLHAYSHINTLSGAAAAFLVKKDRHYLQVLQEAYDYLQSHAVFATGGYGPAEQLVSDTALADSLGRTPNSFEVQCGSWAGFKMSKYLISLTGDGKYGDWVERLAINGLLASPPMKAGGWTHYYADYTPGAEKVFYGMQWPCCSGTRIQAVADMTDQLYFRDSGGLFVNLFIPSTVTWNVTSNRAVTVRQFTRFPVQDETLLTVKTDAPVPCKINIRAPAWLAGPMAADLNGRALALAPPNRGWVTIDRAWSDGDRLKVKLPMALQTSLIGTNRVPPAIQYGPVTLAFSSTRAGRLMNPSKPEQDLEHDGPDGLRWHLASDPQVTARPFYELPMQEPYYVYLYTNAMERIKRRAMKFEGPWTDFGGAMICNATGATVEVSFEGRQVRWRGARYDDAGQAEILIDGKPAGKVDLYDPVRGVPFEWVSGELPAGRHVLRLRILETADPKSKGHWLNISGFETPSPE